MIRLDFIYRWLFLLGFLLAGIHAAFSEYGTDNLLQTTNC